MITTLLQVWLCVYLFQGMGSSFLVIMSFLYLHVRILQHIKYSTRKNLVKHKSSIREIFYSNIISYCLLLRFLKIFTSEPPLNYVLCRFLFRVFLCQYIFLQSTTDEQCMQYFGDSMVQWILLLSLICYFLLLV